MSLVLERNDFPKEKNDEIWSDFCMTVASKNG